MFKLKLRKRENKKTEKEPNERLTFLKESNNSK
jgi:hypothetical protein